MYRAQFPLSLREIHEDTKSDVKTVLPAVILLMALSAWGASFLRNTSKRRALCAFLSNCGGRQWQLNHSRDEWLTFPLEVSLPFGESKT